LPYKELSMSCIFDKKINKIKTVLYPVDKKDSYVKGLTQFFRNRGSVKGIVISIKKSGYLVLLKDYGVMGMIRTSHSYDHIKLKKDQEIDVSVLFHGKYRKTDQIRTYLKLAQ